MAENEQKYIYLTPPPPPPQQVFTASTPIENDNDPNAPLKKIRIYSSLVNIYNNQATHKLFTTEASTQTESPTTTEI